MFFLVVETDVADSPTGTHPNFLYSGPCISSESLLMAHDTLQREGIGWLLPLGPSENISEKRRQDRPRCTDTHQAKLVKIYLK